VNAEGSFISTPASGLILLFLTGDGWTDLTHHIVLLCLRLLMDPVMSTLVVRTLWNCALVGEGTITACAAVVPGSGLVLLCRATPVLLNPETKSSDSASDVW